MMHDVGFADVLFILLVLGVIHGIMYWISCLRKNESSSGDETPEKPASQS